MAVLVNSKMNMYSFLMQLLQTFMCSSQHLVVEFLRNVGYVKFDNQRICLKWFQ